MRRAASGTLLAAFFLAILAVAFLGALGAFAALARVVPALHGHLSDYGSAFATVFAGVVAGEATRRLAQNGPEVNPSVPDEPSRPAQIECIVQPMKSISGGLLGVDRARAGRPVGAPGTGSESTMPPYVERDIDRDLRPLLSRNVFVLIIGDATTGKTRTLYEAALRELPDHTVIAPQGRGSVGEAVDLALGRRNSILWLDKLYKFAGPEGLTRAHVDRLLNNGPGHRVILATMTGADYATFTDSSDAADQQTNRDVRDQARIFFLERRLGSEETRRARAKAGEDVRIAGALRNPQFGLPEYLAAGPELFEQWQAELHGGGAHPRGAALIGAAVDLLRAGLSNPLPRDLIERQHSQPPYLPQRAGSREVAEPLAEAWAWAMTARPTAAALSEAPGDPGRVTVFNYLPDELERQSTPANQVPENTLRAALTAASAPEAMRIGQKARNYGRYRVALQAFSQAAEERKAHLGEGHPYTLVSRNKIARALRGLGRLHDSELELRAILQIQYTTTQVDQDPHALTTRDNLARVLRASGHPEPAAAEHRAVLTARTHILGADHPDTLTSLNGLARALRDLRRLEEAQAAHRTVLEARRRNRDLGERHPDTLTSRADLAIVWRLRGRLEQAREALQAVLRLRTEVLGADHPDTLSGRREYALVLQDLGRLEEAEAEFLAVYQGRIRSLYEEHPATAVSHGDLTTIRRAIEAAQPADGRANGGIRSHVPRLRDDHPAASGLLDLAGRLPLIRQIDDPAPLGVHRAGHGDRPLPYRARDVDDHLRETLTANTFALVVGGAATGKSRTAYEAARAVLPDHVLIAPHSRETVAVAVERAASLHRCVLWLDDLDRFAGPEGLTLADVTNLITDPKHHRVVLGTISTAVLERFTDRSDSASRETNREAIRQAHRVHLPDRFTAREQQRFNALSQQLGYGGAADSLPELLALPALLDSFRAELRDGGPNARGAALVRAAIDCRRAGIIHPISRSLLVRLHGAYLTHLGPGAQGYEQGQGQGEGQGQGQERDDAALDAAWRWADSPRPVLAAIYPRSTPTLTAAEPERTAPVGVLSYLVDEFGRLAAAAANVPDDVLRGALADADATEAMRIGQTAADYGRYVIALDAFKLAAQLREVRLGPTDPDTLASRNKAARTLRLLGEAAAAEQEHRELVEIQRRTLGPNDPATLTSRDNWGRALFSVGRIEEAQAQHLPVLEARTRILGPEHPDTLSSRNNLAHVQLALRDLGAAEANHRAVLEARTRILGEHHRDTLTTRNDLARVRRALGRASDAEAEHAAVLQQRTRILGENHPDTLTSRHDRAACLADLGQFADAIREFETVLKARTTVLGADHCDTVDSRAALDALREGHGGRS